MKQWIGLTLAGIAVVAVWALPIDPLTLQRRARLPEVERYQEMDQRVRRDAGVLTAMRFSDSLSQAVVRDAVDGLAVGVPPDPDVAPEGIAAWVERMRASVRSLEPRDPEMVLGYFYVEPLAGFAGGLPGSVSAGEGIYVGERDGTPYCMYVYPQRNFTNRTFTFTPSLRLCTYYARFGRPGPSVSRWLEAGALRFATGRREDLGSYRSPTPRDWIEEVDGPFFGLMRNRLVDAYPPGGRCLAGDAQACANLVTDPPPAARFDAALDEYVVEHSPLTITSSLMFAGRFTGPDPVLLSDLETEFGTDAFARFWRSDADVPDAFEAAFGVDLPSWAVRWFQEQAGVHHAGPRLQEGTPLLALLTLMALGAFATFRHSRRRVG